MDLDKLRNILNAIFILLAVATIITYFACNNKSVFMYTCGTAVVVKMVESVIRITGKYR